MGSGTLSEGDYDDNYQDTAPELFLLNLAERIGNGGIARNIAERLQLIPRVQRRRFGSSFGFRGAG